MPVPRKQWEAGLGNIETRILEFLGKNSNLSYNLSEIGEKLGLKSNDPATLSAQLYLSNILSNLARRGLIEEKDLDDIRHYTITESAAQLMQRLGGA